MIILIFNLVAAILFSLDYKKTSLVLFIISFISLFFMENKFYNLMLYFSSSLVFNIIFVFIVFLYNQSKNKIC